MSSRPKKCVVKTRTNGIKMRRKKKKFDNYRKSETQKVRKNYEKKIPKAFDRVNRKNACKTLGHYQN